jgi:hypothetical protein
MPEHRFDPSTDPGNTPVPQLRTMRLVAAMLDDINAPAVLAAHAALGRPKCLTEALNYTTALLVAGTRDHKHDILMVFEMQIVELERKTWWGSAG